ncbi:MAG: response regulator [Desulfuromusa sp.]|nr:response regulator [Desulfuromusa sp.]
MKKKALVIDDDPYFLDVCIEYLKDKGLHVSSLLSPSCTMIEQNLETCPMNAPCYDIVLSDNNMPKMKGLEFFFYLSQRGCKVPAYCKALISGDISPQDRGIAEGMGCKVFQKPTPLHRVDSWIDDVLGRDS